MQATFGVQEALGRIVPNRKITGISAVLLPFTESGDIDDESLANQLRRCVAAGLTPAVNMDTGYVNLLTGEQRQYVLDLTRNVLGNQPFVAGAFIEGQDGEPVQLYRREVDRIVRYGGTPIMFQCSALKQMSESQIIDTYRQVAQAAPEMYAFELGEMFVSFGQIYRLDTMRAIMEIPQITGAKHSSLNRILEWQRLELRDRVRPEFKVFTGNDLAIDMVMYGSDYLLGLSTFSPEGFAARDRMWEHGDPQFYHLNDLLQYLGMFAFRAPVPAYKHSAAQFLAMRGVIKTDITHPSAARRPDSDREILHDISARLDMLLG